MSATKLQQPVEGTRWLSREYTELLLHAGCEGRPDFDVLIVGSGYGGAMAAAELAGSCDADGKDVRVGLLERGIEWLPGAFPTRLAELPRKVRGRFAGQSRGGEGLFDVRLDGDVGAVVANGLGGGSLINAGVLEAPDPDAFSQWPVNLQGTKLSTFLDLAKERLGAKDGARDNTISLHPRHQKRLLDKYAALKQMAKSPSEAGAPSPGDFRDASISVAMSDHANGDGVRLQTCQLCGDCATGCNFSAKKSLDTNLLVEAFRRGAEIYCGATVLRLDRDPNGPWWRVMVVPTDEKLRLREGEPRWITAARVVLAAGTLGSTEILLRSRSANPKLAFSSTLGQRFSANGDMLAFGYDQVKANAFACEQQAPRKRRVGPTITGVIRKKIPGAKVPIAIEELAVPGPIRRLAQEVVVTANTFYDLGKADREPHVEGHPTDEPTAVRLKAIGRTNVFAAMGDDGAGGVLRLDMRSGDADMDGQLRVDWPEAGRLELFDRQIEAIEALCKNGGFGGGSARLIPNPLWRFLPPSIEFLIGDQRGPLLTAHPLGGCPMADDANHGVVNEFGEVFDPSRRAIKDQPVHEGLYVLDGSIVPGALSINPALTIAALALRAVEKWRDKKWGWTRDQTEKVPDEDAVERPSVRQVPVDTAPKRIATTAEFTERLSGRVDIRDALGKRQRCLVEITLTYARDDLQNLFVPRTDGTLGKAKLSIGEGPGTGRGVLRIFTEENLSAFSEKDLSDPEIARQRDASARSYALSGDLIILRREESTAAGRVARGLRAWWLNRGARDTWQAIRGKIKDVAGGYESNGAGIWNRVVGAVRLASRAGEVRRFDYELTIGNELPSHGPGPRIVLSPEALKGKILGRKRITYARPSNPWRQLQEMTLVQFPPQAPGSPPPVLKLDQRYLATQLAPLFRLTAQGDHVDALMDVISLLALFSRLLVSIHIWSARKPDRPRVREINRLPGRIPKLPEPEIHWVDVDQVGDETIRIRLARYRRKHAPSGANANTASTPYPVVTFHGYSAGGTTFAHPAVRPSLAQYLAAETGRDVWVVDLRTSCGLKSAEKPWTFERVAMADIPAAIQYVVQKTGKGKVDVVAHCMGAAMLSMALLWSRPGDDEDLRWEAIRTERDEQAIDRFRVQRQQMRHRIRRIALSQIGPVMVFSPANALRAFATSFIEQILGDRTYRFRPEPGEGLGAELLDRLLATMPYPDDELLEENPKTPWARREYVGSRHRMDALYGADFKLDQLRDAELDCIDDFFGPLNLDTVAQGIHLTRQLCITNRAGRNRFVNRSSLIENWKHIPTFSFHGTDNGLADISTLWRMKAIFDDAGCRFIPRPLEGRGHQDTLIGKRAEKTFKEISRLFDLPEDSTELTPGASSRFRYVARAPWMGPVLQLSREGKLHVGCGAAPGLGIPVALYLTPVRLVNGLWVRDRPEEGRHRFLHGLTPEQTMDWICRPFPTEWLEDRTITHVVVLVLYDQSERMDGPEGRNTWSQRVERTIRIAGLGHGDKHQITDPLDREEHKEISRAIDVGLARICDPNEIPPRHDQADRSPPLGVIALDWRSNDDRNGLRLALGSCQYSPGMLDRVPAYAGWSAMKGQPELMVLAGDQIYADASAGLFDPAQRDDRFRLPYEGWLRSPWVRDVLRRVPTVMLVDDHEIDDNWEQISPNAPSGAIERNARLREEGERAFRRYQRTQDHSGLPLWYNFQRNGIPIFLLDTRFERELRDARGAATARMFSDSQMRALKAWLLRKDFRELPKLVVSPSLLLPRHRAAVRARLAQGKCDASGSAVLRSDAWDGFPATLYELLGFIGERQVQHLVFLSGDEHLGLFTEIALTTRTKGINETPRRVEMHSVHAPGLYSPYSFANAALHDFVLNETLAFESIAETGSTLEHRVEVKTTLFPGDGFVDVTVERKEAKEGQEAKRWRLEFQFPSAEPDGRDI